jgi:hypothetical protein
VIGDGIVDWRSGDRRIGRSAIASIGDRRSRDRGSPIRRSPIADRRSGDRRSRIADQAIADRGSPIRRSPIPRSPMPWPITDRRSPIFPLSAALPEVGQRQIVRVAGAVRAPDAFGVFRAHILDLVVRPVRPRCVGAPADGAGLSCRSPRPCRARG